MSHREVIPKNTQASGVEGVQPDASRLHPHCEPSSKATTRKGGRKMAEVKIKVLKDGPYEVDGEVELLDARRNAIPIPERPFYLCRCGQSANKPFCDGSHKEVGFKANGTS